MTSTTSAETGPAASSFQTSIKSYQWKFWKLATVGFAGLMVVAGGVLAIVGGGEPAPGPGPGVEAAGYVAGPTGDPSMARGLTGGTAGGTGTGPEIQGGVEWRVGEEPESGSAVSPALLRGGISFFVAFCLAFALRAFLRIGAIFVGIWALSLFVLAYAGWVEVHWDKIDRQFIDWTSRLGDQFASFKAFITGSLPSTGLAGLGLFTGFKKK